MQTTSSLPIMPFVAKSVIYLETFPDSKASIIADSSISLSLEKLRKIAPGLMFERSSALNIPFVLGSDGM